MKTKPLDIRTLAAFARHIDSSFELMNEMRRYAGFSVTELTQSRSPSTAYVSYFRTPTKSCIAPRLEYANRIMERVPEHEKDDFREIYNIYRRLLFLDVALHSPRLRGQINRRAEAYLEEQDNPPEREFYPVLQADTFSSLFRALKKYLEVSFDDLAKLAGTTVQNIKFITRHAPTNFDYVELFCEHFESKVKDPVTEYRVYREIDRLKVLWIREKRESVEKAYDARYFQKNNKFINYLAGLAKKAGYRISDVNNSTGLNLHFKRTARNIDQFIEAFVELISTPAPVIGKRISEEEIEKIYEMQKEVTDHQASKQLAEEMAALNKKIELFQRIKSRAIAADALKTADENEETRSRPKLPEGLPSTLTLIANILGGKPDSRIKAAATNGHATTPDNPESAEPGQAKTGKAEKSVSNPPPRDIFSFVQDLEAKRRAREARLRTEQEEQRNKYR